MPARPKHAIEVDVHEAEDGTHTWQVTSYGREGRSRVARLHTTGEEKTVKKAHAAAARSAAKEHLPA